MATGEATPLETDKSRLETDAARAVPAVNSSAPPEIDFTDVDRFSRSRPWRLSHLMYMIAVAAVIIWVGVLIGRSFAIVAVVAVGLLLLLFVAAMGTGVIFAWRAATKQEALLQILAIAAEGEMPLAPAVAAFADQYGGLSHRRIMQLAARLNSGTRPAEALKVSRGLVTQDAVLLAWVGEAAGVLPKALRIAAASRSNQLPVWTSIAARVAYILILLLSMQTICGFIMYFIVPKLEAISMDFKIALPDVTIFVIHASQFAVKYAAPALLLPFAEVGLLILLPFSFLGWGNYSVPVFDRVLAARHSALVLRCMSLFVEAGKPIALGLATLRSHYPAYWVKRRLTQAESDVRHGTDWIQALWQQRLIGTADAHVLASSEAVGNLSWACAQLAQTLERRLAVRFQMLIQALFPLAVVMLGLVVFILATAYFLPLVNIIQSLT